MTSSHLLLSAILIHSSKLFSIFLISFFLNLSLTHSFTPAYLHHFHFLSLPTPPQPSSPSILAPHSFLKGDQTWLWNMCRRRAFPPRWDSSVVGRRRRGRAGEGILCYHSLSSSLLSFSLSLSLQAEMMYDCKGPMLVVWWIKALCRKITESASAHTSLALNKTLFNIEMERARKRGREIEED